MPSVTIPDCHTIVWSYIDSQCPPGIRMVTPQPVERRSIEVNLIPITINIDANAITALAAAAWLIKMIAFAKAGPDVYVDSKPVPVDQAKIAQALEGGSKGKIEGRVQDKK